MKEYKAIYTKEGLRLQDSEGQIITPPEKGRHLLIHYNVINNKRASVWVCERRERIYAVTIDDAGHVDSKELTKLFKELTKEKK